MFSDSENVKQISERKLLTKMNENSSLERTLEYDLVDLSEDMNLENYSETSLKTSLREGSNKLMKFLNMKCCKLFIAKSYITLYWILKNSSLIFFIFDPSYSISAALFRKIQYDSFRLIID